MTEESIWLQGTDWNSKPQLRLCIDYRYSYIKYANSYWMC